MNPEPQQMLAVCLRSGQVNLEQVTAPIPNPGEARIKVRMAGVCRTDLQLIQGYKRFEGILGHELVGVVDQCDEAGWLGQRVVAEINIGCGACPRCADKGPNHCAQRRVVGILGKDGGFAAWVTVPTRLLHRVPEGIDDEAAVFVEPLAAALRVLEQVRVRAGESVAVLGDGRLGLLVAQVMARLSPARRVVLVGRHPEKLALAAPWGVETSQEGQLHGRGFDLVVEATGSGDGLAAALELVRPEGTVVLKSTFHGLAQVDVSQAVVAEVRLIGSRCGPFQVALQALERGDVEVRPLIEAVYRLEQGLQALDHAGRRGALKVLLDMR